MIEIFHTLIPFYSWFWQALLIWLCRKPTYTYTHIKL
jgi:hypothetical protein